MAFTLMLFYSTVLCREESNRAPDMGFTWHRHPCYMSPAGERVESSSQLTPRWRELDSNPQFPARGTVRSSTPIIAPPIGRARQKRLERLLDWFKRYGFARPAQAN
jgi:hypothetical protein